MSSDDKIQVRLVEPAIKSNSNTRLNKANILEFDLTIEPSKSEEITIKYTIENPSDKEIEHY